MENSAVGSELNSSAPILTDLHLPKQPPSRARASSPDNSLGRGPS